jgi:DNA-binding NarL/FixJ family response regulator
MESPNKNKKIRLMLVDDHIVVRMGLATAANSEPDMEVVAEADNGDDAVQAFRIHRPDVVVLDLRMPKKSGLETIQLLKQESNTARILIFSNYASGDEVYKALKAGALGFIVKDMSRECMLEAIRKVHEGGQYFPPEILQRMNGRVLSQLSPREAEVLSHIAKGLSNKEIGAKLNIVEGTIKAHINSILAKLGVSDRTQAILAAVKRGIIQIE